MRHEVRSRSAVGDIENVKSRRARRQGEVRDADVVTLIDAVAVAFQSVERPAQKTGRDRRGACLNPRPHGLDQRARQSGHREPHK